MRACSLWLYINAVDDIVRVSFESDCDMLYKCNSLGCTVKTTSSLFREETRFSKLGEIFPLTPSSPSYWQPYPPFRIIDASIVIDSKPGMNIYGLEYRKATVISLVQRTLLEGKGPLQLTLVKPETLLSENEALTEGWLAFETSYPLIPMKLYREDHPSLMCHYKHESAAWGECLYKHYRMFSHLKDYVLRLEEMARRRSFGFDIIAGLSRLYAGAALQAGIQPLWLAEAMLAASKLSPVWLEESNHRIRWRFILPTIKVGVNYGGVELYGTVEEVRDVLEKLGLNSEDIKKSRISVICRLCWHNAKELCCNSEA